MNDKWYLAGNIGDNFFLFLSYLSKDHFDCETCENTYEVYGLGHEGVTVLLPGFAIKW